METKTPRESTHNMTACTQTLFELCRWSQMLDYVQTIYQLPKWQVVNLAATLDSPPHTPAESNDIASETAHGLDHIGPVLWHFQIFSCIE